MCSDTNGAFWCFKATRVPTADKIQPAQSIASARERVVSELKHVVTHWGLIYQHFVDQFRFLSHKKSETKFSPRNTKASLISAEIKTRRGR